MDVGKFIRLLQAKLDEVKADGLDAMLCSTEIIENVIALLKEQEVRELTIDEWRKWKKNQKRDPLCMLWENETFTIWVLDPNEVHEPALLMGQLKLFTGKPTFEQCKEMKWE